jgi:NAD(P)-dependent dehydrogenase (short-subunit alcohol dehydrogenase family)
VSKLENKTALITGGSKGIGLGIAEAMLQEGMNVAITGRTESIKEVAAQLNSKAYIGRALGLQADVTDLDQMENAVYTVISTWGILDVVIANAGVGHFAPIQEMSAEKWHQTIDTNLTGVFNTVKPVIEPLSKSKGYLFTIASLAGTNFFANGSAYNASKFGLVGFTQAIMLDLRKLGIRVSTIMPGSVTSHFNDHIPSDKDDWKIQPEDIGQMIVDVLHLHPRTLPSKIEVRPSLPN